MLKSTIDKIADGLKTLEIEGKIDLKEHDSFSVDVYVNGEWYGLWDTRKNTFVE